MCVLVVVALRGGAPGPRFWRAALLFFYAGFFLAPARQGPGLWPCPVSTGSLRGPEQLGSNGKGRGWQAADVQKLSDEGCELGIDCLGVRTPSVLQRYSVTSFPPPPPPIWPPPPPMQAKDSCNGRRGGAFLILR